MALTDTQIADRIKEIDDSLVDEQLRFMAMDINMLDFSYEEIEAQSEYIDALITELVMLEDIRYSRTKRSKTLSYKAEYVGGELLAV